MWIIDRYLLRQFITTFLICFFSLTGLYIVCDAFTNLEGFLHCAEKQGGLLRILGMYYGYKSVWIFDRTSGLLTLAAAMLTISWIQRHNELTALMAAGVSRLRVAVPVMGAVLVIIVLAAINREVVIPQFRNELAQRPQDLAGDLAKDLNPQYDEQTDVRLWGKATFEDRQRIEQPDFRLPAKLDLYGKQLRGKDAFYQPPEGDRPGGYLFEEVEQPKDLHLQPSLALDGRPVLLTPRDTPWLKKGQCFLVSGVSFDQLTNLQAWGEFSSTYQLIAGLKNRSLDFGGKIRVAIHSRILQPWMDAVLLFLGLPLVVVYGGRNIFIAMGVCGAVITGFQIVVMGFQQLGASSLLNPTLAAWAPLLIFGPIAVEMSRLMAE